MRLNLNGRLYTLTHRDENGRYSGSKYTTRADESFLHIEIAGPLLPQHWRLQIAARQAL